MFDNDRIRDLTPVSVVSKNDGEYSNMNVNLNDSVTNTERPNF